MNSIHSLFSAFGNMDWKAAMQAAKEAQSSGGSARSWKDRMADIAQEPEVTVPSAPTPWEPELATPETASATQVTQPAVVEAPVAAEPQATATAQSTTQTATQADPQDDDSILAGVAAALGGALSEAAEKSGGAVSAKGKSIEQRVKEDVGRLVQTLVEAQGELSSGKAANGEETAEPVEPGVDAISYARRSAIAAQARVAAANLFEGMGDNTFDAIAMKSVNSASLYRNDTSGQDDKRETNMTL